MYVVYSERTSDTSALPRRGSVRYLVRPRAIDERFGELHEAFQFMDEHAAREWLSDNLPVLNKIDYSFCVRKLTDADRAHMIAWRVR